MKKGTLRYIYILFCVNSICYLWGLEQRNGFYNDLSIKNEFFYHKNSHSTITTNLISLYNNTYYYFRDYAKASLLGNIGFGSGDFNGANPAPLSTPLSSIEPRGVLTVNIGFALKGGYNLSSLAENWNYPLYISIGYSNDVLLFGSGNMPFVLLLSYSGIPLEFDGSVRFSEKWELNYLLAYDFYFNSSVQVGGVALTQTLTRLRAGIGHGARMQFGFAYKVGEKTMFYAKFNVKYQHIGQTNSAQISTITQPTNPTPGIIYDTSATVYYPSSHTLYGGIEIGFRF